MSGRDPEDEEGERIYSFQHPVIVKRLLCAKGRAIGVEDEKGLGRGGVPCKGDRMPRESLGGARTPTPSIPNLAAQRSRARAPELGARSGPTPRARALAAAPPPAAPAPAPARAHSGPPLCVSSIRYVQNGPSAAAAARGGRGGGGEGRRCPGPEEGPQPAAGRAGGEPGWGKARVGARSPCPSPLASPPATGHYSQSTAPCLGVLEPSRPRGCFSCCTHTPLTPKTQNPEPKRGKESLLLPPPSSCANPTPRLLCEITQQQALLHSACKEVGSLRGPGACLPVSLCHPPGGRGTDGVDTRA